MIQEIKETELKEYCVGSKSCVFDKGIRIEATGNVKFDLKSSGVVDVIFRRNSGNGSVVLLGAENKTETIHSRIGQEVKIQTDGGLLFIQRPTGSLGEITVIGLKLHKTDEGDRLGSRWKSIIAGCESTAYLRVVGDSLYAASGGFIARASQVKTIQTNPPNMFVYQGDRVEFIGSCEITVLQTTDKLNKQTTKVSFPQMQPPDPILRPEPNQPNQPISSYRVPMNQTAQQINKVVERDSIVFYDSKINKGLDKIQSGNKKLCSYVSSNGSDFIGIKGTCSGLLPLPLIVRSHTQYVLVMTCKKLSGNGKLQVNLTNGTNKNTSVLNCVVDSSFSDQYLLIETGEPPELGEPFKLNIAVNGSDILITRVRLIFGLSLDHVRNELQISQKNIYQLNNNIFSLNVTHGSVVESPGQDADPVTNTARKYARFSSQAVDQALQRTDIRGNITSATYSGLGWLNKTSGFFPNLSMQRNNTTVDSGSLICNMDSLTAAKKIWIDAFEPSALRPEHLTILRAAETILCPSQPCVQLLSNGCPDSTVLQRFRPLPWIQPRQVELLVGKPYCLVLNRSTTSTQRIIESWDGSMPPIVLLGARGKYPEHVIPFNEYLEYRKQVHLITNAKCIVDLPQHRDYDSAFLHMGLAAGVPIASSNWQVMDKAGCQFMVAATGDPRIPSIEVTNQAIHRVLRMQHRPAQLSDYNSNLFDFMTLLMSHS